MAVLQGGRQNLPPPRVCVIQKTPCGIGLNLKECAIILLILDNVGLVIDANVDTSIAPPF